MFYHQLFIAFFLASALSSVLVAAQDDDSIDPNAFCLTCHGRRNSRNYYSHPTDCHKFYQCFFHNETSAEGQLRQCPPMTYFNEFWQSCSYEGPVPCQDICAKSEVQAVGCAPIEGSCNQYIWCSSSSEVLCCPLGTAFNASTCQCDTSDTCNDVCNLLAPAVQTSVAPVTAVNDTHCINSFGNLLTVVPDRPNYYGIVDPENGDVSAHRCALGSEFLLGECRCDTHVNVTDPQPPARQCSLYLPFDADTADHSRNRFTTFTFGDADFTTEFTARGEGSFSTASGGRIEIPGTKTIDLEYTGTYCLFYRCVNGSCPTGGLLSNNNNENLSGYGFILASLPDNSVGAFVKMIYPDGAVDVSATVTTTDGFNQVCAVFNSTYSSSGTFSLYINNQMVASKEFELGWISPSNCPFAVGTDQKYGDFGGNIDEVLICPFAFTEQDVNAHYQGKAQLEDAQLV